jgi:hypothetical protein
MTAATRTLHDFENMIQNQNNHRQLTAAPSSCELSPPAQSPGMVSLTLLSQVAVWRVFGTTPACARAGCFSINHLH